jgi:hypothetical protein
VGRGWLGHIDTVALGWTGQAVDVRLAGTLPDLGDLAGRIGCTSPLTTVASCSELAVLRRVGGSKRCIRKVLADAIADCLHLPGNVDAENARRDDGAQVNDQLVHVATGDGMPVRHHRRGQS